MDVYTDRYLIIRIWDEFSTCYILSWIKENDWRHIHDSLHETRGLCLPNELQPTIILEISPRK